MIQTEIVLFLARAMLHLHFMQFLLSVDILMTPDLRCRVLDEDELPDDLDSDLRVYIDSARDALCIDPGRLLLEFEAQRRELFPGT